MKEKIKVSFTKADVIIVKSFGSKVEEFYGDKFKAIDEYVKQMVSDDDVVDKRIIEEFSTRTSPKLMPLLDEMIENNFKRNETAIKLKEQIEKKNPDMAKTILSKLATIDFRFKKFINDNIIPEVNEILSWKTFYILSSQNGLIPVFVGETRGTPKEKLTFTFQTSSKSYEGKIIKGDFRITIEIVCPEETIEFFISGSDYTMIKKSENGVVIFEGLTVGEYVICCEGKDFMVINITE